MLPGAVPDANVEPHADFESCVAVAALDMDARQGRHGGTASDEEGEEDEGGEEEC